MTDDRTAHASDDRPDDLPDETELELRALLTERSGVPKADPHPVATLTRRHRRRRAARAGATAGVTSLAVVAVVLGPQLMDRSDTPDIGSSTVSVPTTAVPSRTATPRPGRTPTPTPTASDATVGPGPASASAEIRFLETDRKFRASVLGVDDPATVVRCATDDRGNSNGAAQTAHFVWAVCAVLRPSTSGANFSLPVRIDYDGNRIAGFLTPGGLKSADAGEIEEHFPRHTLQPPSDVEMARLEDDMVNRIPWSELVTCSNAEATRVMRVYTAVVEALLKDDVDRGLQKIYVVGQHRPGDPRRLGGPRDLSATPETGRMPAAVRECLRQIRVNGMPIAVVDGERDPAIRREGPGRFSPVLHGVIVTLSAVPPGDAVVVSATADYGGGTVAGNEFSAGTDFHGGEFEVSRTGDRWTAVKTGAGWSS